MNVTEFRAVFDKLPTHGWLTLDEALMLVDWASRTEGPMVEIGSYHGRSAVLLASMDAPEKRRHLTCVDSWDTEFSKPTSGAAVFADFEANLRAAKVSHLVTPVISRVEDWTPTPAGFVYCDGDHSYQGTRDQLIKALECKPDVICAHDVNDKGGGIEIKKACLELLGPWDERVNRLAAWRFRP